MLSGNYKIWAEGSLGWAGLGWAGLGWLGWAVGCAGLVIAVTGGDGECPDRGNYTICTATAT